MGKIHIDESMNGKTINVSNGDILEIQLRENATTGYRWEFSNINPTVFLIESEKYHPSEGLGIGGGGIKTLILKVLHKAEGTLSLENKQKWSGNVYKTFHLTYQ